MGSPLDASPGGSPTTLAAVDVLAVSGTARQSRGTPRTFWRDTFRSLKRQKGAMIGLTLIGLVVLAAIVGAVAVPDSANRSVLGQRLNPPGPSHLMGTDGSGRDILLRILLGRRSRWRSASSRSRSAACLARSRGSWPASG